jgi:carboxypeptidase Q
MDQHVAAF